MPKTCCRCNASGRCTNCSCKKANRVCVNCLPFRQGHCNNPPKPDTTEAAEQGSEQHTDIPRSETQDQAGPRDGGNGPVLMPTQIHLCKISHLRLTRFQHQQQANYLDQQPRPRNSSPLVLQSQITPTIRAGNHHHHHPLERLEKHLSKNLHASSALSLTAQPLNPWP